MRWPAITDGSVAHDHGGRRAGRRVRGRRITDGGVLHDQHRIRQVGRLLNSKVKSALASTGASRSMRFERLDPALRLLGLAGLEAGDELLQVGDLVLLLGVGVLLQLKLLARVSSKVLWLPP